jgi:hypothetical protein
MKVSELIKILETKNANAKVEIKTKLQNGESAWFNIGDIESDEDLILINLGNCTMI